MAFNQRNMQALLNKDVPKLGYRGDMVKVKSGYFRNFLSPRGLAVMSTPALVKVSAVRKERMVLQRQQLIDNAKEALGKLKGLKLTLKVKVSAKGKLYGAITEDKIIAAVKEATNIKLEKEFIKMKHIKEMGDHEITIHLGPELEQIVKVSVKAA